jgi:hypothetical protein
MKKSMWIITSIFFLTASLSSVAFADRPDNRVYEAQKKKMGQGQEDIKEKQEHQKKMMKHSEGMERKQRKYHEGMRREDRKHHKEMGMEYRNRPDYHKHNGYRERPYDKGRHYGHFDHKGHRYNYHGHWRSWEQWDRYAKRHPNIYRYGKYYREGTHLMFRFCDPGTDNCIFFSIGR